MSFPAEREGSEGWLSPYSKRARRDFAPEFSGSESSGVDDLDDDRLFRLSPFAMARIMGFLSSSDLMSLASVSHRYRTLVMEDSGEEWLRRYIDHKQNVYAPWHVKWLVRHADDIWNRALDSGTGFSFGLRIRAVAEELLDRGWLGGSASALDVFRSAHRNHVITCLMFDGQHIVTASDDCLLKVWSPLLLADEPLVLSGHEGGVWCGELQYPYVFSGSTDKTARVWYLPNGGGRSSLTIRRHTSTVRSLKTLIPWSRPWLITGSRDTTVIIWRLMSSSERSAYDSAHCLMVLRGHSGAVRCLAVSATHIVSGSYDNDLRVFAITDDDSVQLAHQLRGHRDKVYCVQLKENIAASGSMDTSVRVWDVQSGRCLHVLRGHAALLSSMLMVNQYLLTCSADKTVQLWNLRTGSAIYRLAGPNGHTACITGVAVNRKYVITCADDGFIKVWNGKTGEFVKNLYQNDDDSAGPTNSMWGVVATDLRVIAIGGNRVEPVNSNILNIDLSTQARNFLNKQNFECRAQNDWSFIKESTTTQTDHEDVLCWFADEPNNLPQQFCFRGPA